MEVGKVTYRWLAFPHALALGELLYQAFIVCVRKQSSIVCTVIIQRAVNPVDCLGTNLDPLASDKNDGANLEWKIGVEFPHNWGHSGDKGCTECLPAAVLDDEVEEHIRGWKTSFWDKREVEQGLVVDSLGLLGNEPVGILRGGGGGGVPPARWSRISVSLPGSTSVEPLG